MTTTNTKYGPRRRLYLLIDGVEPAIWQDDGTGIAPEGIIARSGIVCLNTPENEYSWGLQLGSNEVTPSSMDFVLNNILDPCGDGTYYFSKLFAPGKQTESTTYITHLTAQDGSTYVLDSNATEIVVADNSAFPASGFLYLGQETCTYDAKDGTTKFTGVSRGLYPCTNDLSWAYTYKIPDEGARNSFLNTMVSTQPYSIYGRLVALYLVLFDETTGAWDDSSAGELLWVGRITSKIQYDGERGQWIVSCENILTDLEVKKLGASSQEYNMAPPNPYNHMSGGLYNFMGDKGRTFTFRTDDWWGNDRFHEVTIDKKVYTQGSLKDAIALKMNATLTVGETEYKYPFGKFCIELDTDTEMNRLRCDDSYGPIIILNNKKGDDPCYLFQALGFDPAAQQFDLRTYDIVFVNAITKPYNYYHPCDTINNGGLFYTDIPYDEMNNNRAMWKNQGDSAIGNRAAGYAEKCLTSTIYSDKDNYLFYYSGYHSYTYNGIARTCFDLTPDQPDYPSRRSFVGVGPDDDEAPTIKNVFKPFIDNYGKYTGPFEMLLYPLLSTGTSGYNDSTYDKLDLSCSVGMRASLVDKASFINADMSIADSDLLYRKEYIISDETWLELLKRECALFGYALVWDMNANKLTLKSVYEHSISKYVVTLDDGNNADPFEKMTIDTSTDTVINKWECKCSYSNLTKKYGAQIDINDVDSINGLGGVVKSIKIEHPGITTWLGHNLKDNLIAQFNRYRDQLSYPWQTMTRTLAPELIMRISIGDIVRVNLTGVPNPYGDGSMTVDCLALVLNTSWNFSEYTGKATLLLYSRYSASEKGVFAASSMTDRTQANGGFNEIAKQFNLIPHSFGFADTDYKDGLVWYQNDIVNIVERAPTNAKAPQVFEGVVIAKNFEADGANLLTISNALVGWNAQIEYVIVPTSFNIASNQMFNSHAWQTNPITMQIGETKAFKRYG